LNGQPVLFDFMDAGDVLDLLFSVADHLDELRRKSVTATNRLEGSGTFEAHRSVRESSGATAVK